MSQSDQINELVTALAIAQGSIQMAEEDKKNFFKTTYASYGSLRKASQKSLSENGLCITHVLSMSEKGQVLTTQLSHKSGQWMRSEVLLPVGGKGESTHELGKSITYCKRYSYAALICIGTGEEDEDENVGCKISEEKSATKLIPIDFEAIENGLKDSESFKGMLKYYRVASLKDVPPEKMPEALKAIESMLKGAR